MKKLHVKALGNKQAEKLIKQCNGDCKKLLRELVCISSGKVNFLMPEHRHLKVQQV